MIISNPKYSFSVLVLFFLLFNACRLATPPTTTPLPTLTTTITLTIAPTRTPTYTPVLPAVSPPPSTPTPVLKIHTVRTGDTLSEIAFKFGLNVQDLLASNPDLDERIITAGQKISIPQIKNGKPILPQPTPVPLPFSTPACIAPRDGGVLCYSLAQNNTQAHIEGLSVQFSLHGDNDQVLTSLIVTSPLERVAPGKSMPIMAYFPPPLPVIKGVSVFPVTCLPAKADDVRFLSPQLHVSEINVLPDGMNAHVKGQITLPPNSPPAGLITILAAGYDFEGNFVGTRTWKGEGKFSSSEVLPFEMQVFSFSAPIANLDVQAEAKP